MVDNDKANNTYTDIMSDGGMDPRNKKEALGEDLQAMKGVNRFEVIDEEGRSYVKYLNKDEGIKFSLQDDNRTLKVFIDSTSWKSQL